MRTGFASFGRRAANTTPTTPATISTVIAAPYPPLLRPATRIVPATAVPSDEPRFETLRERPEMSPCSDSGKAPCTMFTDGVSIRPSPSPTTSSPGTNAHGVGGAPPTSQIRIATPTAVIANPR